MPRIQSRDGDSTRQAPSKNPYRQWLERQADAGNYFLFFRDFLFIMSIPAAVMLQSLINLGRTRNKDGWVRCTSTFIESQLGMTRREQDTRIAELVRLGFIETKRLGLPAQRWMRVNLEAIHSAIDNQLHSHGATERTRTANIKEKYSPNGEYSNQSQSDGETEDQMPFIPELETPDKKRKPLVTPLEETRASHLHGSLKSAGLIARQHSRRAWAEEFARLRDAIGVDNSSLARVSQVLSWYCSHIKEPYMPQAWSAKSFRMKFLQIEAAMKRHKEHNPEVALTPTAERIVKRLLVKSKWPGRTKAELPAAVQQSLDNVKRLRVLLIKFDHGTLENWIIRQFQVPENVVMSHFQEIAGWLSKIKDFNGSLFPKYIWGNGERFDNLILGYSQQYTGKTKAGEKLLKGWKEEQL